jgi:hypothetical protein
MSHAGFHRDWFEEPTIDWMLQHCAEVLRDAKRRIVDPLLGMGMDRGGSQHIGGPLWMDWCNLVPIPGINQVVGHTPDVCVREKLKPKSRNYCLDVGNGRVAAILEDGELEILNWT